MGVKKASFLKKTQHLEAIGNYVTWLSSDALCAVPSILMSDPVHLAVML